MGLFYNFKKDDEYELDRISYAVSGLKTLRICSVHGIEYPEYKSLIQVFNIDKFRDVHKLDDIGAIMIYSQDVTRNEEFNWLFSENCNIDIDEYFNKSMNKDLRYISYDENIKKIKSLEPIVTAYSKNIFSQGKFLIYANNISIDEPLMLVDDYMKAVEIARYIDIKVFIEQYVNLLEVDISSDGMNKYSNTKAIPFI